MKTKCPRCEEWFESKYMEKNYTGNVRPRRYCDECKGKKQGGGQSVRYSKRITGESYKKSVEATRQRRGVSVTDWAKEQVNMELDRWRAHRADKIVPLPRWMIRMGDYTSI